MSLLLIISAFLLCACNSRRAERLSEECLRIHIRANSDSDEDQRVKLAVRDKITARLQTTLEGCDSKSEAIKMISAESENLIEIANQVLYDNNFTYKASIRISNEHFPDRDYNGYFFPEGDYDAVVIELGSGKGANWWCVAFPPLCFVPDGDGGEKIVYKSWIKEILDRLF